MSLVLRLLPQTRLWSPLIWEVGQMFGIGQLTAVTLIVLLAIWAGSFGVETVKRAGAVALPIMLIVLIGTAISGLTAGFSKRFLPLAATNVISADVLLIAGVFAWLFDILKKVEKN